ncbi:hypothetical protein B0H17DRAFT_1131253 [Mycena rosella]|uniref:Uncharacterized protein n=1 Tax=Mycena rosella TaxID=1033263 RepID=A0AAD7GNI3_MYCRO|nr:hypothetical protein B0H17DRAFT_1131253 [Mycena rosella]
MSSLNNARIFDVISSDLVQCHVKYSTTSSTAAHHGVPRPGVVTAVPRLGEQVESGPVFDPKRVNKVRWSRREVMLEVPGTQVIKWGARSSVLLLSPRTRLKNPARIMGFVLPMRFHQIQSDYEIEGSARDLCPKLGAAFHHCTPDTTNLQQGLAKATGKTVTSDAA